MSGKNGVRFYMEVATTINKNAVIIKIDPEVKTNDGTRLAELIPSISEYLQDLLVSEMIAR